MRVVGTPEAAAHGAALIAATGAGAFGSIAEASTSAVEVGSPIEPTADSGKYEDAYDAYRGLYPALRSTFHRSADLEH
jgi:xylulokinase